MSYTDSIPEDESGGMSNILVQNMQYLGNDFTEQVVRLERVEERTDQVVGNQGEILRAIARLQKCVDGLQRQITKKKSKRESRRPPPRKKAASQTTKDEMINLNLLPLAMRDNIINFLENMSFEATIIPDELIQAECLSEDECDFITSKQHRKDQIRLLIRKIMRRGPETIKQFLHIIKKDTDQSHLVNSVYATLQRLAATEKKPDGCTICLMMKNVDLKDIADLMWKEHIIDDDTYDDITGRDTIEKQFLWNKVVDMINMSNNIESAIRILAKALQQKYNYISQELGRCTALFCSCRRRKRAQRRIGGSYSSQTDISTTSRVDLVPRLYYIDQSDSEQSESRDRQTHSFDRRLLKDYDEDSPCDSTTNTDPAIFPKSPNDEHANNNRARHSSGKFQQTETHTEVEDQHFSLPLLQNPFLNSSEDMRNLNDHHAIIRSNDVTVAEAQSTTHGDEEEPMSTDETISHRASVSTDITTPSPDVKGNNTGMFAGSVVSPDMESASDCHNEESANETRVDDNRRKVHRRIRRLSARQPEEDTYADDDDDDDNDNDKNLAALKRTRHKTHRAKFYERQKSAPAGTKVTESRTKFSQTGHDPDEDKRAIRGSKSSRKRAERRASKQGETSMAAKGSRNNIPYNPSWTTQPQNRNTRKWDYYQARRYSLMAHRLYPDQPTQHTQSDTDFRTDGSDAVVFSDYTV